MMSLRATLWALDTADVNNPTSVLVLIALADECDDEGGSCHPSLRRIAARARVSVNTARDHVRKLESAGLVEVTRPEQQGRGHHNRYRLLMQERVQIPGASTIEETRGKGPDPDVKRAERVKPEPRLPVDPLPVDPKENTLLVVADATYGMTPEAEFERWWRLVPRRTAKGAARKAFKTARGKVGLAVLCDGADRWSAASVGVQQKYVPHPATWLNQERWLDDPPPRSTAVLANIQTGRITDL